MQVSPGQSAIPEHSQNVMTQSCLSPASVLPTEYHLNQGTQESSLPFSDTCSNLPAVSPALPTPYSSECQTLAKANSNGTAFLKDGAVYCTHRSPVCEESYQSFTHRNTEEESILPWRRRINGHQNERTTGKDKILNLYLFFFFFSFFCRGGSSETGFLCVSLAVLEQKRGSDPHAP